MMLVTEFEELCVCICELLADADAKLLAQRERTLIPLLYNPEGKAFKILGPFVEFVECYKCHKADFFIQGILQNICKNCSFEIL